MHIECLLFSVTGEGRRWNVDGSMCEVSIRVDCISRVAPPLSLGWFKKSIEIL